MLYFPSTGIFISFLMGREPFMNTCQGHFPLISSVWWFPWFHTPWKFNSSPLKISHQERKVIFQPSFFRGALLNFGCVSSLVNLNFDLIIHFTNCHCKLNFNKVDSIIMNWYLIWYHLLSSRYSQEVIRFHDILLFRSPKLWKKGRNMAGYSWFFHTHTHTPTFSDVKHLTSALRSSCNVLRSSHGPVLLWLVSLATSRQHSQGNLSSQKLYQEKK